MPRPLLTDSYVDFLSGEPATLVDRHTESDDDYDGSYVENHCPECGEPDSECICDDTVDLGELCEDLGIENVEDLNS